MAITRKGIVYTIIAIVFLAIIAIVFFTEVSYSGREKQESVETRIMTMDDFITDFYADADRAAYISGYRSFIAMEQYVSDPAHGFMPKPEETFKELFMNGTIDGQPISLMENASFESYLGRVNTISKKVDIALNLTLINVSLSQHEPWSIDVQMNFSIVLIDKRGLARWNFSTTVTTNIPIYDLKDPLYTVNTGLPVTIQRWNGTEFVHQAGGINDTTNLTYFINETFYINSTRAPSFLMRYSNNLSNSTYGIESMVNIQDISQKGLPLHSSRSIIDFIYFNGSDNTAQSCNFTGLPGWIALDNETIVLDWYQTSRIPHTNCT